MKSDIRAYHARLSRTEKAVCVLLERVIDAELKGGECKIWHRHPVWFIEGNPIVGYSKLKSGVRLMFWSGASFKEEQLKLGTGKFKDASITYTDIREVNTKNLKRWCKKARRMQWDYKNIVKRRGRLVKIGRW
jgi:hypothetical protein